MTGWDRFLRDLIEQWPLIWAGLGQTVTLAVVAGALSVSNPSSVGEPAAPFGSNVPWDSTRPRGPKIP